MTGVYLALYAIGAVCSVILAAFYLWVDTDPEDPPSTTHR
jgi:hypothetical protein